MFRTVVREHHWAPEVLGALFLDAEDHLGLEFWYNDICYCIEVMRAAAKKKTDA